jgi:cation-transporting ATPase 13A1
MYKILALNCLVSAYSLSVLYLDGVKLGDSQATVSGMLIAFCFLFISRAQVRNALSASFFIHVPFVDSNFT